MCWNLFKTKTITDYELPNPGYWLKDNAVLLDENTSQVIIDFKRMTLWLTEPPKIWVTTVQDTNSDDPFFDYRHTVLLIAGKNEDDHKRLLDAVQLGDIVVADPGGIIHAVTEGGNDKQGRYWRTKGLNPQISNLDPQIWRDENIKWICVAVIYTDRKS